MVSKNTARYLSRKETIKTQAKHLSTLCGIDVLLVIYSPDSPNTPETWCSQPDPATVINKYYANKKNTIKPNKKVVKPGPAKNHNRFLEKLSLTELKNLDSVLAAKIENVKQRIDLIKKGNNSCETRDVGCGFNGIVNEGNNGFSNLYETRDLVDYGNTSGFMDYDGGINVDDLGINNGAFVNEFGDLDLSNPVWTTPMEDNGGINVDDLGINNGAFLNDVGEFDSSNPVWTTSMEDYCEEIDISDLHEFLGY